MTAVAPPPRSASRRARNAVILAVGLLSSSVFLWLVLRGADLDAVWRALRHADAGEVALAAVVVQAVYVAQAARWRLIAGARQLSVSRFYALVLGGIGANNILPLRIGDLLRGRWLATSAPMPTGTALGSVFRDRSCDVLVLVLALAVSIPFVGGAAWVARIVVGGVVLVAVLAVLLLAAVVYTRSRPRARLAARASGALRATRSRRSPRRSAVAALRLRSRSAASPGARGRSQPRSSAARSASSSPPSTPSSSRR
jgi:uncharacterized protein (TIRG00374 family)